MNPNEDGKSGHNKKDEYDKQNPSTDKCRGDVLPSDVRPNV